MWLNGISWIYHGIPWYTDLPSKNTSFHREHVFSTWGISQVLMTPGSPWIFSGPVLWRASVINGEHQASAEAFGRKKPPTLPCQRRFATFPSDSKWIWIKLIWKKMVRAAWPWLFDSFTVLHYVTMKSLVFMDILEVVTYHQPPSTGIQVVVLCLYGRKCQWCWYAMQTWLQLSQNVNKSQRSNWIGIEILWPLC